MNIFKDKTNRYYVEIGNMVIGRYNEKEILVKSIFLKDCINFDDFKKIDFGYFKHNHQETYKDIEKDISLIEDVTGIISDRGQNYNEKILTHEYFFSCVCEQYIRGNYSNIEDTLNSLNKKYYPVKFYL